MAIETPNWCQISLDGNFQVLRSILNFQPFLAILAFLSGQKWLKNQKFEKMKNNPLDLPEL